MNKLEFKTVIDTFGIEPVDSSYVTGRYVTREEVYRVKDVNLAFGGSYYTRVFGEVPYTVAKILSKKYPDRREDIRIEGTYGYGKVGDKSLYDVNNNDVTFVSGYHIDSKEGLIYFLSELEFYYQVGIYTEENRRKLYRRQKDIIAEVNRRLIEAANLSMTTEEWIRSHDLVNVLGNIVTRDKSFRICKKVVEKMKAIAEYKFSESDLEFAELLNKALDMVSNDIASEFDTFTFKEIGDCNFAKRLQSYVKDFDFVVNPFESGVEMKDPSEFADDTTIHIYSGENKTRLSLDKEKFDSEYLRGINENEKPYLTHKFSYGDDLIVVIRHIISLEDNKNVINVHKFASKTSNCDKDIDLRFDLVSGLAWRTYHEDEKHPITEEEFEFFVSELEQATKLGSKLSKDMIKTESKLTLRK